MESIGFVFNPYNACIVNQMVNRKQQTIKFHVDNLLSSHQQREVSNNFLKWLNEKYGHHGEVTATRGNEHEYLAMLLKFIDGKLIIDMTAYVKKMLEEFPIKFNKDSSSIKMRANRLMTMRGKHFTRRQRKDYS